MDMKDRNMWTAAPMYSYTYSFLSSCGAIQGLTIKVQTHINASTWLIALATGTPFQTQLQGCEQWRYGN